MCCSVIRLCATTRSSAFRTNVLGQRVAAVVQLAADADDDVLDDILDNPRAQLADYKVPERLQVIGKIPRNGIGKIDRNALAAHLADAEYEPVRVHA